MPGVTKRIYEHELMGILIMWNNQLKTIERLLPQFYTNEDVISLLKHFYPHEWNSVQAKYEYYATKDKHIKRRTGKTRYNMPSPEKLINRSQVFKRIKSSKKKSEYSKNTFLLTSQDGKCDCCKGKGEIYSSEEEFIGICEKCDGKGFTEDVLKVKVDGLNIYEIYNMPLDEMATIINNEKMLEDKAK